MESSGNVVVDFGKFCTGFLVVMGIGMLLLTNICSLLSERYRGECNADIVNYSTARRPYPLRSHPHSGDDYVYYWRVTDLWDNHQLHYVFPGRARVLKGDERDREIVIRSGSSHWEQ